MTYRFASIEDSSLLAELNQQLIEDEHHRIRRTIPELKKRMEEWLANEYRAVIFEVQGKLAGYALYRLEPDQIYLRQLLIVREHRRHGLGREAIKVLRERIWPKRTRLTVDVLITNTTALEFWRAVGFRDYCVTLEVLPD